MSRQSLKEKWVTIDQASDPSFFVRFMDNVRGGSEDDQEHYRAVFDLLEIENGGRFLDVGCGTGGAVRALAKRIGHERGSIFGTDKSETMVEEARKRAEGTDLPIEFSLGDAHSLPFIDNYFDGIFSLRVFEIIENARQALTEMVRVIRPGGRVVINAPDIDSWTIDASDRDTTRTIIHYICDHETNGWIGRQLPGLCREAGLVNIKVVPVTGIVTDFDLLYDLWLREIVERAQQAGAISMQVAASWLTDLKERHRTGHFFCSQTQFRVTARKP